MPVERAHAGQPGFLSETRVKMENKQKAHEKVLPSMFRALGCRKRLNEKSLGSYEHRGKRRQEVQVTSVPSLTYKLPGTQEYPPDLRSVY